MDGPDHTNEIVQLLLSHLTGILGTKQLPFNVRAYINDWAQTNGVVLEETFVQKVIGIFRDNVERKHKESMVIFIDEEVDIVDY